MGKKLIGIAVIAMMLFGIFGLTGCDTVDLAKYKTDAKAEITNHVSTLSADDYASENWALIGRRANEGKAAVDAAADKAQVDTAVSTAKTAINAVENIMGKLAFNSRFFLTTNAFLKDDFRASNRVYGVNYGDGDDENASENPYPFFRVIIIQNLTEYKQTYTDNTPETVDFDREMLVMYTFAHTEPCSFQIMSVCADSDVLCVSWKSVGVAGLPGHNNLTAPKQQWIVLQMDKFVITTAEFTKV